MFRGKSFSPRFQTKREEGSPQRRLRFVLIFSHPAEELRGCYWSERVERLFVCKVANAMKESGESFASPPLKYFITLLNFKCECFCKEVQWNLDIKNLYITKSTV